MTEPEDNFKSPMNYLKIFFRRKELLLLPTFIGLIGGICAGLVLPKQYRSSTVILVEEGKTDNPLFNKLAVSSNVGERLSTIHESMVGWHSLVKLAKRLKMDKTVKTPQEFERLVLDIRRRILIKLRGHNIIFLAYTGDTPEMTQAVVQNIADIFINRNVEIQNQNTSDAITFIEEQLKIYKGKIISSEIADLKDKLNILLLDSTERHPSVKRLREQIDVKEKELQKENLQYTDSAALKTQSNNPLIEKIKKTLDKLESKEAAPSIADTSDSKNNEDDYYKVMLIDKLDNVMARDANVNTNIYNMLLQRLETAKITQNLQSSKEGTKYTVLDPPRIPFSPIQPNKTLLSLGGLLGGALFGVALIFLVEFLDKSFIDVEEATQYFGTPLLGAISKINTEASLRAEKEKQFWMYGLTFVAGIITVMLTMAITNFKG